EPPQNLQPLLRSIHLPGLRSTAAAPASLRRGNRGRGPLAPPCDHIEVEKVHRAEDEQNEADLRAQELDGLLRRAGFRAELECERHVTHVDQVEADDEHVIDRVCKLLVLLEAVDQKHAAVLAERAGHPHRQPRADAEIRDVGQFDEHLSSPLVRLFTYFCLRRNTRTKKLAYFSVAVSRGRNRAILPPSFSSARCVERGSAMI